MVKPLESIIINPILRDQWLSPESAVNSVLAFERRFGQKHLKLACYAALPLILTPELVNLIHINFLDHLAIDWIAETDFLLSPLCRSVSEGVYEVKPCIREVLLMELEEFYGQQRSDEIKREIAKFLWIYLKQKPNINQRPEHRQTHEWIARAYMDPDSLVQELNDSLQSSCSEETSVSQLSEQIQVVKGLEFLTEPLAQTNLQQAYQKLVHDARVVSYILYGDEPVSVPDQTEEGVGLLLSPSVFECLEKSGQLEEKKIEEKDAEEKVETGKPIKEKIPKKREKSELSVVIKVSSRNKNFRWDNLRNSWQTTFGGEISEPKRSRNRWTFTWTGADWELVLEHAQKGLLDREITSYGGSKLIEIMEDQECLYEAIPDVDFPQKTPQRDVGVGELQAKAPYVDLLLMTITDIERKAVLSEMDPWPGEEAILVGAISYNTYRFGQFGRYRAAQVESTMGGEGRDAARATLQDAITELKPKAILLIGIAFGINRRKQRLGDVIIAESVFNYPLERIGEPQSILRGGETHCGRILSEGFRTRRQDWKLRCERRVVKVHQGLLLSGPELIDNKEFRDQLVGKFANREPLGGEMEGAGAYEVAERNHVEVILIKGICDWADGHKNDRAQPFAAYAAVSLAKHVLIKPHVLAELGARDVPYPPPPPPSSLPKSRYRLIIYALRGGHLVPFIGEGVLPSFYIDLAKQLTKLLKSEFFGEESMHFRDEDLMQKLMGSSISDSDYFTNELSSDNPFFRNIDINRDISAWVMRDLMVAKRRLRSLSYYYIRKTSLVNLYYELYEILEKIEYKDSQALHQFLAILPSFMLSRSYPKRSPGLPYQLIVTTNYDDMLEQAFSAEQQPYDVVFYVADGDERGKFKHKSYEGNVQTIDTPNYKLPLRPPWGDAKSPRPIILKLFGTCDRELETKFVATEQHLTFLLDHLALNLPTSLMSIIRQSSILFMGYSSSDIDLDRIVRYLWSGKKMQYQSCLIHQAQPGYVEKDIWNNRNVDLIRIPSSLDDFMTQLKGGIEAKISEFEEGME